MNDNIFRKKSIERIESPESLNDTIRVANPGVWMLLAAVILLLAGACVWGMFGKIETTLPVDAAVRDGMVFCSAEEEDFAQIAVGMSVRIGDVLGNVTALDAETGIFETDIRLADGVYAGEVIVESIHPFSFVFN